MQRLIITADDYGMCEAVDKAIDAGIANGFITTTNVMLNMQTLGNAKKLRERFPRLSIGIHWNVTTGNPVSSIDKIPTLVDSEGKFWPVSEFKKRFSKGLIDRRELAHELEAQYALFEETCGHPDYWNTHENSSLHTKAFSVFSEVALRHGVEATRTFQRVYFDKAKLGIKASIREFLVKSFFEFWFSRIRKKFKMPNARVVRFKRSKTEGDALIDALKKDGRDLIEVVFHPATVAENEFFGNIAKERVSEYEFLSSREIRTKYENAGFAFVGFDALE